MLWISEFLSSKCFAIFEDHRGSVAKNMTNKLRITKLKVLGRIEVGNLNTPKFLQNI